MEKPVTTSSPEPVSIEPVPVAAPKKGMSKKWLFLIIGGALALCLCVVVVIIVVFVANAPASTKDYLTKTGSGYSDVKAQLAKVSDSILNSYSVNAASDTYVDIKTKVDTAYALAANLETKVNTAQQAIPTAGSDIKTLDTSLKDYYSSVKILATSYKQLLAVHQQTLPIVKDVEAMTHVFNEFAEPTTAADFTSISTQLRTQSTVIKNDLTIAAAIQTNSENAYIKTSATGMLNASDGFLNEFITFSDKAATALKNNDDAALTAAANDFTNAGQGYQDAINNASTATQKTALMNSYKSQLEKLTQKQTQTDTEFTNAETSIK